MICLHARMRRGRFRDPECEFNVYHEDKPVFTHAGYRNLSDGAADGCRGIAWGRATRHVGAGLTTYTDYAVEFAVNPSRAFSDAD
jgi:hypothetical protein